MSVVRAFAADDAGADRGARVSGALRGEAGAQHGNVRLHGRDTFISEVLSKEAIGLEEVDDGVWSVFFHHVLLACFTEQDGKLHP